jgi:hypothetical protein
MLHLAFLFQSGATLICYYYLYEVEMFHLTYVPSENRGVGLQVCMTTVVNQITIRSRPPDLIYRLETVIESHNILSRYFVLNIPHLKQCLNLND